MRIGSLFSGAGGLDMAVEAVFGGRVVWHCEQDAAASKVLATRWSDVPNIGDITVVDWTVVESVDILCGGYPCQPFSAAGGRKGTDDERHLWPYFAEAIRVLRPRYAVLENVAGHRSMGFDQVLADLAHIGYVGSWRSVRASDVGAPHRRERLFVLATDATRDGRPWLNDSASSPSARVERQRIVTRSAGVRAASDTAHDGRHEGWPEPTRVVGRPDAPLDGRRSVDLIPTPRASDAGPRGGTTGFGLRNWTRDYIADLLPTPRRSDGDGGANPLSRAERMDDVETRVIRCDGRWGKYEPAIRRWEQLTRPAPSPIEPNTKGNPRLHAPFAEWMMGWPAGWVTDPSLGISRNDQLRIIGNGVVPQQATVVLRWLLTISETAALRVFEESAG